MKNRIMVSHGNTTHPMDKSQDCTFCLEVEIEYLEALKRAGGITKFIKSLKEKK